MIRRIDLFAGVGGFRLAMLRLSCRRGNCPIALMYSYNEALQPFFE
jgi:site-specific DNA-cytosine methylase